jgi:hypothetical protein
MPRTKTLEEFIEDAVAVHGDKYDYSLAVYTNSHTKLDITCPTHGIFSIKPHSHTTSKQGCAECAGNKPMTTATFIAKAAKVHGTRYDYSNVVFTTSHSTVNILCAKHGEFVQQAYVHLQHHGCPLCGSAEASIKNQQKTDIWSYRGWAEAGITSKAFKAYSIYIIRCWDKEEEFIKVGKTFMSLNRRFSNMPYIWSSIRKIEGDATYISTLEEMLHKQMTSSKYSPSTSFNGSKECYTLDSLPLIHLAISSITKELIENATNNSTTSSD